MVYCLYCLKYFENNNDFIEISELNHYHMSCYKSKLLEYLNNLVNQVNGLTNIEIIKTLFVDNQIKLLDVEKDIINQQYKTEVGDNLIDKLTNPSNKNIFKNINIKTIFNNIINKTTLYLNSESIDKKEYNHKLSTSLFNDLENQLNDDMTRSEMNYMSLCKEAIIRMNNNSEFLNELDVSIQNNINKETNNNYISLLRLLIEIYKF